ncbi:MAG TPA: aspartate kinase [Saprospiraceae bacterium]|nr:aspartate kinase [Saprospiraceae bacterium]HND88987.1 aspartate kinase [Saprospiraceae bacterium]
MIPTTSTPALRVFKFGGASLRDAAGIRNVASILQRYAGQPLVIVVSAMGKTTNALEEVINAHAKQTGQAHAIYEKVKEQHYAIMRELFEEGDEAFASVHDAFVEGEWVLDEAPADDYDYMYDQIVCVGEMVSSRIAAAYLNKVGLKTHWLDARDVVSTDNTYREGWVIWDKTKANAQRIVPPMLAQGGFVLTQGFIGSTSENFTTTLGREGSDYSGAIFSFCLDAESMSIWKDVAGVLNADPRLFENTIKLDRLSYKEAIEMTYYGASVIHPKTIKPLQNKNIPLYVKSFLDPDAAGTEISSDTEEMYPPIIVVEKNQALLHISTLDYSFVAEHHMARLFGKAADLRIFVNMMQNTAISFTICVPNVPERIERFVRDVSDEFKVKTEGGLELITVRHYTPETIESLKRNKMVLFEERIRNTMHMVVKNIPPIERRDVDLVGSKGL